jgi:hypothetical protein
MFRHLNVERLITITLIIGLLTFSSFFLAFAKSEGGLGEGFFRNLLADSFVVFSFPIVYLLQEFNVLQNWTGFLIGLVINTILFATIIEIVWSKLKMRVSQ